MFTYRNLVMACGCALFLRCHVVLAQAERTYENRLTPIPPHPLLADYPEFVEPIQECAHFEAPVLVNDALADLHVRTWRFSHNARGVIEIPNRLESARTAVVVVHPWGINDGQGWQVPEPAGFAFGTPEKVRTIERHMRLVVRPFLQSLRGHVAAVVYSLPGERDAIRGKLYRSVRYRPSDQEQHEARQALRDKLRAFNYRSGEIPSRFVLSRKNTVADYLRKFPGNASGDDYNGPGFWQLPIPVHAAIDVHPDDVVVYDAEGYEPLKDFLVSQGVEHVLLAGYHASLCYCSTAAGYLNLEKDFNVFLVGDATLDVHPGSDTPRHSTAAAMGKASVDHLITQVSWIRPFGGAGE